MAMFVVLRFEDDEEANDFISDVVVTGGSYSYSKEEVVPGTDAVGMFKAPTQFCYNLDGHRNHKTGWTCGKKWGWWVCPGCGKPSWNTQDGVLSFMANNLLLLNR